MEDWIARAIAIAGVLVALFSLGLTAFLWWKEGPGLKVEAFIRPEAGSLRITVSSTGRLSTTVKTIELRDVQVLKLRSGGESQPFSRWTLTVNPAGRALPTDLAPTDFLDVDVAMPDIVAKAGDASELIVRAWVQRGDGRWETSKDVRIR